MTHGIDKQMVGSCSWARRQLALVPLLFACACGGERGSIHQERDLLSPATLDEQLVLIDRANDEALLIDVLVDEPEAHAATRALPPNPFSVQRRLGADELLVLTGGDPEAENADDQSPTLAVLDADGVSRIYPLGARFSGLIQSEDGRYAFAFFDPSTPSSDEDDETLLFNPNEVAIVDLSEDPGSRNPFQRTLRSFGASPQRVVFSPDMEIAGQVRRLAVVLFERDVAVMDLNHLSRNEFTVELTSSGSIDLEQVRFSREDAKIYLRGRQSNDIFVLNLLPRDLSEAEEDSDRNDFVLSLNQLGAGATPEDMVLYGKGNERRLLAVNGSEALLIEANSSRVTSIALPAPAETIVLFEAASPKDSETRQRALLYSQGNNGIIFVDLDSLEERQTRNVEMLSLPQGVARFEQLDGPLALVIHQNRGLSLLNLEERTVAPINANVNLLNSVHDRNLNRLWITPPEQDRVAFLDLETFHPSEVRLDQDLEDAFVFTSRSPERLVVTHASDIGELTILDANDPGDVDRAITLRGFLLNGILDTE